MAEEEILMDQLVSIVIPIYKEVPTTLEEIGIQQCFNLLSGYRIIAIKPKHLQLHHYNFKFDEVISFEDEYFQGFPGYNKLLRSASFYAHFLSCKYMLIYQPDAFVFHDDLRYWCNQGYDYIGAPWITTGPYKSRFKKLKRMLLRFVHTKLNLKQPNTSLPTEIQTENRVGNGGLSLRNTAKFYKLCLKEEQSIAYYNSRPEHYFGEDVFWSVQINRYQKQLNIPDYKTGIYFSMESNLKYAFQLTGGKLPFGCHAWDRDLNFWGPILIKMGVDSTKINNANF